MLLKSGRYFVEIGEGAKNTLRVGCPFFGGGGPTLEKMGGTHFVQEWGDMTWVTPKMGWG